MRSVKTIISDLRQLESLCGWPDSPHIHKDAADQLEEDTKIIREQKRYIKLLLNREEKLLKLLENR